MNKNIYYNEKDLTKCLINEIIYDSVIYMKGILLMEDAKNIAKNYNPQEFEDKLYNNWVTKGYFHAEVDRDKKPFTIVIPPPNVTGQLHMGHALDETLQDILIRYKRMQGYSTLWVPGTDHAGIATQIKVEEELM